MVRSILYPCPVDFKFERDSYKFVGFLTFCALIGFTYTCVRLVIDEWSFKDIFLAAADLITIVVPPALPAAMTVGSLYAESRLKAKGIFCISPRSINISGSIDCVCFDKTGTLTEDGLDLMGVVRCDNDVLEPTVSQLPPENEFLRGMATCHALAVLDGQLSGDPLDIIMFEATKWVLEDGGK